MKTSKGIITDDPALNAPVGTQLQFKPLPILPVFPGVESLLFSIDNWEFFEGTLLSIHFKCGNTHSIQGSGVIVAPGVAICAKHVLAPYMDRLMSSECEIVCMAFASHDLQIWRVRKVTHIDGSDLSILGLSYTTNLPPDSTFNLAMITTRLPKIGEKLIIAGFRASADRFEVDDSHKSQTLSGEVFLATGVITERYPSGRDRIMLPWPVFEVNCPSLGGMSGGPVFDLNGFLVGILCSGMNSEDNKMGTSYVSLLFPALASEFEGGWPEAAFRSRRTLIEMDRALCHIDYPFTITVEEKNGVRNIRNEIWE